MLSVLERKGIFDNSLCTRFWTIIATTKQTVNILDGKILIECYRNCVHFCRYKSVEKGYIFNGIAYSENPFDSIKVKILCYIKRAFHSSNYIKICSYKSLKPFQKPMIIIVQISK